MDIEALIKLLGLDETQAAKFRETYKKYDDTVQTKIKQSQDNLKIEKGKVVASTKELKEFKEKVEVITDAFNIDLDAEDIDKAVADAKEEIGKTGGSVTPEEVKEMQRELTKTLRDNKKLKEKFEETSKTLIAEKGKRQDQLKRSEIKKALIKEGVIKSDQMVDLFIHKAKFDDNGEKLFITDKDGTELTVSDFIADWAKESPELVDAKLKGGAGSGAGSEKAPKEKTMEDKLLADIVASKKASKGNTDALKNFFN